MTILIFLLLLGYGWASTLPNGCPSNYHIHMLLPHETDCSKFYQCAHGTKVLKDCAPGTLFDERLQSCAWPNTVECLQPTTLRTTTTTLASTTREPTTRESTTRESTTQKSTTQDPTTQIPTTTQNPAPECPKYLEIDIILKISHKKDCKKYVNCSDGVKILMNCPLKRGHFDLEVSIKQLFKRKSY